MIKLIILAGSLFFFMIPVKAQGIQFENASNWNDVVAKAKKENKYIFLDCYATWCTPCKYMDKTVYPEAVAGEYFNTRFVSVKVQMDKTKKDPEEVKQWYKDAKYITDEYSVSAYPTYLFFSPDGKVLHRLVGGTKTANEFIAKAKAAFDPAKQYYTNVGNYKEHTGDSAFLLNAIKVALASSDRGNASAIGNYFIDCLKNPYTKENLQVIRQVTTSSKDKGFELFFKHGDQVDAVMGKNFSSNHLSGLMYTEMIKPYFENDIAAPDWKKLKKKIKSKYPMVSDRSIDQAIPAYYRVKGNVPEYEKAVVAYMKKYGGELGDYETNDQAWTVFMLSDNKELLQEALKWSQRAIELVPKTPKSNYVNYLDTYANLLYKLGNKDEALKCQKKVIDIAKNEGNEKIVKISNATIEKMEKGEKTWQ